MGASGGGLGSRFGASVSGGGLNASSRSTNNSPGPASRVNSMPAHLHNNHEDNDNKVTRGDAELEKGIDISMKSIKSGSVATNPFLTQSKTNSSGMPMVGMSSPTTELIEELNTLTLFSVL